MKLTKYIRCKIQYFGHNFSVLIEVVILKKQHVQHVRKCGLSSQHILCLFCYVMMFGYHFVVWFSEIEFCIIHTKYFTFCQNAQC